MTRYRLKPVEFDAFRWVDEVNAADYPEWLAKAFDDGKIQFLSYGSEHIELHVHMPNGLTLCAVPGDWILYSSSDGGLGALSNDMFQHLYEEITDDTA